MKEKDKPTLFDLDEFNRTNEHWKDMPEFVQKDLTPIFSVIVHFEKKEDVKKFAELIGQTITYKTRSLWYPKAEIGRIVDKLYVDEGADELPPPLPTEFNSSLDETEEPQEFERLGEEYFQDEEPAVD